MKKQKLLLTHYKGKDAAFLLEENVLCVIVDNSPNEEVYPQVADFTFYGGLYRDVNIVCTNSTHFELEHFGGKGLKITPKVSNEKAEITIDTYTVGMKEEDSLIFSIIDMEENTV